MLTIENINLICSKFAGTPQWVVSELFISEGCYVFQIRKRVGYWTVLGVKHKELTIRLGRKKNHINGYDMHTQFIKQNYKSQSIRYIDSMRTITDFTICLDEHIKNIVN